jgi:hypothetical protein
MARSKRKHIRKRHRKIVLQKKRKEKNKLDLGETKVASKQKQPEVKGEHQNQDTNEQRT